MATLKNHLRVIANPNFTQKRDQKRIEREERRELRELFLHPSLFKGESRRAA